MDRKKASITTIIFASLLICFSVTTITHAATWSGLSPIPLDSNFELVSLTYDYDPALNKITKTYQYKNITGSTITNPRIVTLFSWSNDICSTSWVTMNYDGSAIFSNIAQSATVENQEGLFDWNALISSPTPPLDSSGLDPSLPVQSTQPGVSYPYVSICTATAGEWANDEVATFSLSFINVLNPYWVQSLSWVVSCAGGDCPAYPTFDDDSDGILACFDNCPDHANAGQEDLLPPGGNGIGDACECECDFNCDRNVDSLDVDAFLTDFGRNQFTPDPPGPCSNSSPCNGDVNCDGNVDAIDVTNFLGDFGRNLFNDQCPPCATTGDWCAY
jgi:hypothetical protein